MKIATQTESVLICVLVPIHCLSIPALHHRERLLRWAGVKRYTRGVANRPPPCSLLATAISAVVSRLCRVSSDFSAVCRLLLHACKTIYRSSAGVDPRRIAVPVV
ncbi:hypothetical protein TNCV_2604251 [Trichonephila clavipes]|nr:hypothetical protein TNCV_2604251 [Trichonephila clavipes]